MSQENERLSSVNCFGYVYHQLGITETEEFLNQPTIGKIKQDFEECLHAEADVFIAFKEKSESEDSDQIKVAHMVLACKDEPGMVEHRSGCWLADSEDPAFDPGFRVVKREHYDYVFEDHLDLNYTIVGIRLKTAEPDITSQPASNGRYEE